MKAGWQETSLGELCELYQPKTITKNEMTPDGPYAVFGANGIIGRYHEFNHAESQLIIGCRGACGTVHLSLPQSWITGNSMVVRPKNGDVDRDFLRLFFAGPAGLEATVTGSAQPQITRASLSPLRVPLPRLNEQQQIVRILDEALEGLARARAHAEVNLQNARELFANFLGATFTRHAVDWVTAPLQQLVENDCTLSYGIVQPGDELSAGLPIVRPTDLGRPLITLEGLKRIDPVRANGYARTKLKGTEILLCVRGSTGVVSMASADLEGANVTRGIVPVRFQADLVDQRLGYFQFLSKPVQDQIRAKTYGAALMQINIRDLREITFVVPPPDQQKEMVKRLESVANDFDLLVLNYEEKISEIGNLRKSILQKAFAGELT